MNQPTPAGILPVGARAQKIGGSYQCEGTIVASFQTLGREQRYVFQFDEPKGMLHIFGPSQVAPVQPKPNCHK